MKGYIINQSHVSSTFHVIMIGNCRRPNGDTLGRYTKIPYLTFLPSSRCHRIDSSNSKFKAVPRDILNGSTSMALMINQCRSVQGTFLRRPRVHLFSRITKSSGFIRCLSKRQSHYRKSKDAHLQPFAHKKKLGSLSEQASHYLVACEKNAVHLPPTFLKLPRFALATSV